MRSDVPIFLLAFFKDILEPIWDDKFQGPASFTLGVGFFLRHLLPEEQAGFLSGNLMDLPEHLGSLAVTGVCVAGRWLLFQYEEVICRCPATRYLSVQGPTTTPIYLRVKNTSLPTY